jgi:hypothetical protein
MEQKEGDKEGGRLIKESQTLYVAASLLSIPCLLNSIPFLDDVCYYRNPVRFVLFNKWQSKLF